MRYSPAEVSKHSIYLRQRRVHGALLTVSAACTSAIRRNSQCFSYTRIHLLYIGSLSIRCAVVSRALATTFHEKSAHEVPAYPVVLIFCILLHLIISCQRSLHLLVSVKTSRVVSSIGSFNSFLLHSSSAKKLFSHHEVILYYQLLFTQYFAAGLWQSDHEVHMLRFG